MALSLRLKVEVFNDEMVVWLPGTLFTVTYKKSIENGLVAKSDWTRDDQDAPITVQEFRTMAWKAAKDKARTLGWIT